MKKLELPLVDFADELGAGYLNLVLRRVSQRIATEGDAYMRQTGVATSATSTAILAYVERNERTSIADIAQALGYSHQAVAQAVETLERGGLMQSSVAVEDLRKRLLSLTNVGRREFEKVEAVADRAAIVFAEVFDEIGVDLFKTLRAFEVALDRRPLVGRLLEHDDGPKSGPRRPAGGLARGKRPPRSLKPKS